MTIVHNRRGQSQQSEDVKEKLEDLTPRLKGSMENANAMSIDGDQAEKK